MLKLKVALDQQDQMAVCDLSSWPGARGQWKRSRASEIMARTSEIYIKLFRPTAPRASENKSQFRTLRW